MDFFVRFQPSKIDKISQRYSPALDKEALESGVLLIEKLAHLDYQQTDGQDRTWVFGDVISYDKDNELDNKGFFYTIQFQPENRVLRFVPDYHSFLPVYHTQLGGELIISSSVDLIVKQLAIKTVNQGFLADMVLFNVPLGGKGFYHEIKRLPYGKVMAVNSQGLVYQDRNRAYDLIAEKPAAYKKSLPFISALFIENCREYFNRPASVALTSGFDGRTLCALAHHYDNDFQCFTHGKTSDPDVAIPIQLAGKLSIKHRHIDLSDSYISQQHIKYVHESLKYSGGMNGFLYPHFVYDAALLSEDKDTMINGFCGSELMRNAHFGGAISSQAVIDLLAGGFDYALERVKANPNLPIISSDLGGESQLTESLIAAEKYLKSLPDTLDKNQKLAVYEFEEVLPKLFGNWIYAGLHYVRSRAPFMDVRFFTEIMATQISQVYRRFMEQNPFKRFWGQYFYATVMQKTWPELGKQPSGKGYAPYDLLSISGKVRIARGYLGKSKRNSKVTYNNLGLLSGLDRYIQENLADLQADLRDLSLTNTLIDNEKRRDIVLLKYSAFEYQRICKT